MRAAGAAQQPHPHAAQVRHLSAAALAAAIAVTVVVTVAVRTLPLVRQTLQKQRAMTRRCRAVRRPQVQAVSRQQASVAVAAPLAAVPVQRSMRPLLRCVRPRAQRPVAAPPRAYAPEERLSVRKQVHMKSPQRMCCVSCLSPLCLAPVSVE